MKTILTDGFLTLEGDIPADLEAKAALTLQIVKDAGGTYNLTEEIAAEMNRAEKDENEKIKLLLLGAGESGKSTFFKQIDLLYGKPWSRDKRAEFRPIIFENTIDAMKTILTDGFL